jgi:hypothetical protein
MPARSRRRKNQGVATVGSLLLSSLSTDQSRMLLMADLCSRWPEVVGPRLGDNSSPGSIIDGVLTVVVSRSIFSHEISMRGGDITTAVREGWGLDVSGVRVQVGKVRRKQPDRKPKKGAGPVTPERTEVDACLDRVKHVVSRDDVAENLARLMVLYRKRFGGKPR